MVSTGRRPCSSMNRADSRRSVLHGLCRGNTRLQPKHAAELTRTQAGCLRQFLDAKRLREVTPGEMQGVLDTIGLGVQGQKCRVLDCPPARRWWITMFRAASRALSGPRSRSTSESARSSGCHTRRRPDGTSLDKNAIDFDTCLRESALKLGPKHPVSGRTPPVKQARLAQYECPNTDSRDAARSAVTQELDNVVRRFAGIRRGTHDYSVQSRFFGFFGLNNHAERVHHDATVRRYDVRLVIGLREDGIGGLECRQRGKAEICKPR